MADDRVPPDAIADAYDELLLRDQVEIAKSLYWDDEYGWSFECFLQAPYPNTGDIPREVMFRVVIPEGFPYAPVGVYSEHEDVRGLPHQEAERGKLCLYDEHLAKRDSSRLWTYLNWTQEWLRNAANGNLLKDGDPYELPAFRMGAVTYPTISEPLLFEEDSDGFEDWQALVGQSGAVKLAVGDTVRGIIPTEFLSAEGELVRSSPWNPRILSDTILLGRWLLLPDLRFERHRPPHTFGELRQLCSRYDVDLDSVLKISWKADKRSDRGILLVGFPIPEMIGEEPREVHWQPLTFPNEKAAKTKAAGHFTTYARQKKFASEAKLPWGQSENCSQTRFSSRGSFSTGLCRSKIALFGCGALGSYVAEALSRGGVKSIALYDADILQHGNLARHTLTASYLYLSKAQALARFLGSIALLGDIRGHVESVPLDLKAGGEAAEDLLGADLIIDCTADDTAAEWLSRYASESEKQVVSLFVNSGATFLTVYGSGRARSAQSVYEEAMSKVENDQTPVPPDEYHKQDGRMIHDLGCWQPTFPARDNHIESLASAALDTISVEVQKGHDQGWIAIIHRRDAGTHTSTAPRTVTELMWREDYP